MISNSNNKRIAKNTIFLYIRMFFMMAVTLYTSRVILEVLGIEDYGIYNVVGGIVVLFTFVNNSMVMSTQRFLNYELGRHEQQGASRVFSASLTLHLFIAMLTFLLAESVGLWFLYNYIKYPPEREFAVLVTYQFSILTTCANMIRAPYNAAIISYERMGFFARISVIEAIAKLAIVYLLAVSPWDKLISYAFLMFVVVFSITFCYYLYCKRSFPIGRYNYFWEKSLYKRLASFSGWSLFGGMANTAASQGLNVLMNIFFGVTANAAMGVASQVNTAVYNFVANFQTAFKPQIVKSYATQEREYFMDLIIYTSKYSYFLLFIICMPLYVCCEEVLSVWLTNVPFYAVSFCKLMLIVSLLEAIQGPLWMSVQATGKIRNYQLLIGGMILCNLPIGYVFLKLGFPPNIVLIIKIVITVLILIIRVIYINRLFSFPTVRFIREVLVKISIVTLLSSILVIFLPIQIDTISSILAVVCILFVINCLLILAVGVSNKERLLIINQIKK